MHLYIFLIFSKLEFILTISISLFLALFSGLIYSSQSEYYDETDDVHEDYEFPYSNKKSTISAADHLKNINEITTPQLHTQKETTEGDYDDRSEIYPDSEEISEEEEEEEEEEGDDADYEHSTIEILGPTRSALNLTTKRETTQSMEHEPVLEGSAENIRQGQAKLSITDC